MQIKNQCMASVCAEKNSMCMDSVCKVNQCTDSVGEEKYQCTNSAYKVNQCTAPVCEAKFSVYGLGVQRKISARIQTAN